MKLNKKLLTYSAFSVIPLVGGIINSALAIKRTKDFFESLPYVAIYTSVFAIVNTMPIAFYFKDVLYVYAALIYSLTIPFVVSYAISKKYDNYVVEITDHYDFMPNDGYLEVVLKMPIYYASTQNLDEDQAAVDLNSLFKKIFTKALKGKLRKSPYYAKLRFLELDKCSNLKVSVSENRMRLRKRCRDVVIEIVLINSNKNPEIKNSTT